MTMLTMPTDAPGVTAPAFVESCELFDLQLTVARRADVLARGAPPSRDGDRRVWLRAEFEVFEREERARRLPDLRAGSRRSSPRFCYAGVEALRAG